MFDLPSCYCNDLTQHIVFFISGQVYLGESYVAEYKNVTVWNRSFTDTDLFEAKIEVNSSANLIQGWWNYNLTFATTRLTQQLDSNLFGMKNRSILTLDIFTPS